MQLVLLRCIWKLFTWTLVAYCVLYSSAVNVLVQRGDVASATRWLVDRPLWSRLVTVLSSFTQFYPPGFTQWVKLPTLVFLYICYMNTLFCQGKENGWKGKGSNFVNWIECDKCRYWYHVTCGTNAPLSDDADFLCVHYSTSAVQSLPTNIPAVVFLIPRNVHETFIVEILSKFIQDKVRQLCSSEPSKRGCSWKREQNGTRPK